MGPIIRLQTELPFLNRDQSMLNLTIPYPINSFDGRELLRAGSIFTDDSASDIAMQGSERNDPVGCMLEHHDIRTDLETFMHEEPYDFIFGGSTGISAHLRKIGEVPVAVPLLQALDNFKLHDYYTYRHSLTAENMQAPVPLPAD